MKYLEGAHIIQHSLGPSIFENLVNGVYHDSSKAVGTVLSRCRPLYWPRHHVSAKGYDHAQFNGLLFENVMHYS